jgi:hypothetical protein
MLFKRTNSILEATVMTNPTVSLFDRHVPILGEHPAQRPLEYQASIPADATIYNARHRLSGTPVNGMELIWQPDAIGAGGKHYAAVLSDDPNAQAAHRRNEAQGAFVVEYVTIGQVREAVTNKYVEIGLVETADVVAQMGGDSDWKLWQQYVKSGLDLEQIPA